jgi:hypothetical protein
MGNESAKILSSKCGQPARVLSVVLLLCGSPQLGLMYAQSATPPQQQEEKKEASEEVPKPPKDDFTVEVYKVLDEKKAEKLTFKDKYRQEKTDLDVDVIVSYYNWSLSPDDYWNRQISIDTKTKEGYVIEKIVKSGFGELGFVKAGEKKTQDVYRREKITESGGVATATMTDVEIGPTEKERFHRLMQKFVLKK